jgi:hypothetical protein
VRSGKTAAVSKATGESNADVKASCVQASAVAVGRVRLGGLGPLRPSSLHCCSGPARLPLTLII